MSHVQGFEAVEPKSKSGPPPKIVRVADSVFVTRPPDTKEVDLGGQVFLEHQYDFEFEASEEEGGLPSCVHSFLASTPRQATHLY